MAADFLLVVGWHYDTRGESFCVADAAGAGDVMYAHPDDVDAIATTILQRLYIRTDNAILFQTFRRRVSCLRSRQLALGDTL